MTPLQTLSSLSDNELMARTAWGEARNQGFAGMVAVCHVILNRFHDGRFGKSLKGTMLRKWAFSCFNKTDPNLPKLAGEIKGKEIGAARCIADMVIDKIIEDNTHGATHYFNPAVVDPFESGAWNPIYMEYCTTIKDHVFYIELRKPRYTDINKKWLNGIDNSSR